MFLTDKKFSPNQKKEKKSPNKSVFEFKFLSETKLDWKIKTSENIPKKLWIYRNCFECSQEKYETQILFLTSMNEEKKKILKNKTKIAKIELKKKKNSEIQILNENIRFC